MTTPTILLVHGSWHGPWCWEKTTTALGRIGLPSRTVALPSCGTDPARRGSLPDDGAAIAAAAAAIAGPVVIIGHSYGGVALTEADLGPNVRALGFLGAFMPALGKGIFSYLPPGPLPPYVRVDEDGVSHAVQEQVAALLYGDCSDADIAFAKERLVPQTGAVITTPVRRCSWSKLRSSYILLTADLAVPVPLQQLFSAQADTVVEMATSHSPFFSQPDALAQVIAGIAR